MGSPSPLSHELVAAAGPVLAVVGAYGTGKTEISVNLALALAANGCTAPPPQRPSDGGQTGAAQTAARPQVQLADLDLVNPYFRSREAQQRLETAGVRVVVPPGNQVFADLPIVLPEIAGLLHPPPGALTLLDVGGDDVGARALSAFQPRMNTAACELWMVINSRRPFSADVPEVLAMRAAIESSSRLAVTGLIANSHLVDETTVDIVLEGWELSREVSSITGLPVRAVSVMDVLADDPDLAAIDVPVLRLSRHMLPPWSVADSSPDPPIASPLDTGRGQRPPLNEQPDHTLSGDHHG